MESSLCPLHIHDVHTISLPHRDGLFYMVVKVAATLVSLAARDFTILLRFICHAGWTPCTVNVFLQDVIGIKVTLGASLCAQKESEAFDCCFSKHNLRDDTI